MNIRTILISLRISIKNRVRKVKKSFLPDRFYTREFVDNKYQADIGPHTYGNPHIFDFNDGGNLIIGDYCSIADGVKILLGGNHHLEWVTTYPFAVKNKSFTKGDVHIGNDVYIGMGAIILSGITIGDGAVIGAGSIVTKNVEPYAIVAGNPAKLLRKRFADEQIKRLLEVKWWDWSQKKIKKNINLLCSENLEKLLAAKKS